MPGPSPEVAGLAQGVKVQQALESVGVTADAWIWRWSPGAKGGAFPEHLALNGARETDILLFGSIPQGDVNGEFCQCTLQTQWRDTRGRFARSPT